MKPGESIYIDSGKLMYSILYYSPTGNSKFFANLLHQDLGSANSQCQSIEKYTPSQNSEHSNLILVYPVHALTAPQFVIQFCKTIKPKQFSSASFVAVGASESWINDAACIQAQRILEKKGIPTFVDHVLAMPSNFLIGFSQELGTKLVKKAKLTSTKLAKQIKDGIRRKRRISHKAKLLHYLSVFEHLGARFFGLELYANKRCTSCGICWNNCASKNIKKKRNGKPGFGFNCSLCMRCMYTCPEKAISPIFSKFVPIKSGYNLKDYL
jgi:ferredoxin/flavodoxin